MDNLIYSIKELSKENFPNHKVYDLLENFTLPQNEIQDYIFFDNDKYTRHLIYKDDDFEILIMCWRPGHRAPIHGHEGEKCFMRVERGSLLFTNYDLISKDPLELTKIDSVKGEMGYLDGPADIHSVENVFDENSITFHIYSKPYSECDIFDLKTGSTYRKKLEYDTAYKNPL
tara:strand:- start:86 stop:604 length:519 start_codon:yes stop_codon:yes gene_type:complete